MAQSRDAGSPEPIRVGLIVPSSKVTMERELAAMLRGREAVEPERFSLHSNRVRMRRVTPEELAAMNAQAARATAELADAVVLSACVQMPSLPVIEAAEQRLGLPVLSAATATAFQALRRLGLPTRLPGAGRLLSGALGRVALAGA